MSSRDTVGLVKQNLRKFWEWVLILTAFLCVYHHSRNCICLVAIDLRQLKNCCTISLLFWKLLEICIFQKYHWFLDLNVYSNIQRLCHNPSTLGTPLPIIYRISSYPKCKNIATFFLSSFIFIATRKFLNFVKYFFHEIPKFNFSPSSKIKGSNSKIGKHVISFTYSLKKQIKIKWRFIYAQKTWLHYSIIYAHKTNVTL